MPLHPTNISPPVANHPVIAKDPILSALRATQHPKLNPVYPADGAMSSSFPDPAELAGLSQAQVQARSPRLTREMDWHVCSRRLGVSIVIELGV